MKRLLSCTLMVGVLGCTSTSELPHSEDSKEDADYDQAVAYRDASVSPTTASPGASVDAPGTSVAAPPRPASEQTVSPAPGAVVPDGGVPNLDEGLLCELRHRFSLPHSGNIAEATQPWLDMEPWAGSGALETTPEGGAYLIGAFGQELELGAGKLRASNVFSGFLHKLDRDCKPLWTKQLHATLAHDAVLPMALTVDAQGNVYVAMVGVSPIDLRPFEEQVLRWTTELLVEKLSPNGESLYRTRIPTPLGGSLVDIEVDDAGQVYLTGFASSLTDLGSGRPFGSSPTGFEWFALTLDARGKYRAQATKTGAANVELSGDRVYMLRDQPKWYDVFALFTGVLPFFGEIKPALTGYTQAGLSPLWSHELLYENEGAAVSAEGLVGGGLAVLFNKNITINDERQVVHGSLLVKRYNGDGSLRSDIAFAEQHAVVRGDVRDGEIRFTEFEVTTPQFEYLRESGPGGLVMGGHYSSDFQLAGTRVTLPTLTDPSGRFGNRTGSGAVVVKLGSDDKVRWVRQQPFGPESALRGLSSSASGEVFVAGLARVNADNPTAADDTWELVVRKLRAD